MNDYHQQLETLLITHPLFKLILDRSDHINLSHWHIAGGSITQSIWNWKMGLPPLHGLKDLDLIYFDRSHSQAEEDIQRLRLQTLFQDLPLPVDVINEARVHEWYKAKFGDEIQPYTDIEDALSAWLPAFSVGIRMENSKIQVAAPFGLEDAFEMIVRPNKKQITEEIYLKMVHRLRLDWPSIDVKQWNSL